MVDYFLATVQSVDDQEIVVDLGVMGLTLQVPSGNVFEKDKQVKIYCHMQWNSENGPSLYGFSTIAERTVFKVVTGCSGIGPKIALAILADLGVQNFITAITTENDALLSKVNGIGKKKAEQIIVHVKHKITQLLESGIVESGNVAEISHINDVIQALQSLNYSRPEINRAMDYVRKQSKLTEVSFDYLLRQALSYLSKQL